MILAANETQVAFLDYDALAAIIVRVLRAPQATVGFLGLSDRACRD